MTFELRARFYRRLTSRAPFGVRGFEMLRYFLDDIVQILLPKPFVAHAIANNRTPVGRVDPGLNPIRGCAAERSGQLRSRTRSIRGAGRRASSNPPW